VTRLVVFCTDYGLQDGFVGVCHGVMASIASDVRIIDLTHAIPRQDVGRGALLLSRAVPYLPPDAVVVAVVDPGVGSERRGIAVRTAGGMLLVGPDNGLLGPSWEALGGAAEAREIASRDLMREPVSRTFHGRDVFAPVGAHLAAGVPLDRVGPPVDTAELRGYDAPAPMVTPGAIGSRVMAVDGFGNVQLNVEAEHLAAAGIAGALKIGEQTLPFVGIFADLPDQGMGAIVDSQGFLALVVNTGNAAERLQLREGDTVVLERADDGDGGSAGPRHLQSVD
jgi:S-adenosyl-L-methionine hydrolase (adenosine-forming)